MASLELGDGPSNSETARIWNCITCKRRKLRCDRSDPCNHCAKSGLDCHYPVSGRVPKRSRVPPTLNSQHMKQTDLLERLQKLESIVTELASQISPDDQDAGGGDDFGELLAEEEGKLRIGKGFWSVFCDEVSTFSNELSFGC